MSKKKKKRLPNNAIVKCTPKLPNKADEKARFGLFKRLARRYFGKADDLVDAHTTTKKVLIDTESKKNIAEAIKYAAEAQKTKAETRITNFEFTKKLQKAITDILDSDSSEKEKQFQLDLLAKAFPEFREQVLAFLTLQTDLLRKRKKIENVRIVEGKETAQSDKGPSDDNSTGERKFLPEGTEERSKNDNGV